MCDCAIFQVHFSTLHYHVFCPSMLDLYGKDQQVPESPSSGLGLPNGVSQEEVRRIRCRYSFLQLPPCKITS